MEKVSVFSTFASEFKTQIRMDKDDFTFIVTSFCYLILSLVCRSGYLDMAVLDVASIVLWGMLMLTTLSSPDSIWNMWVAKWFLHLSQ